MRPLLGLFVDSTTVEPNNGRGDMDKGGSERDHPHHTHTRTHTHTHTQAREQASAH